MSNLGDTVPGSNFKIYAVYDSYRSNFFDIDHGYVKDYIDLVCKMLLDLSWKLLS